MTGFSDQVLVLKFLAASVLLVLLPFALGGTAEAVAAVAVAVLLVSVVAFRGVAGRAVVDSRIRVRDNTVPLTPCGHTAPDVAGHVLPRAPGSAFRP
ncbi:hypothetical protein [Nocardia macrotermitis]|uniref:Uncharacterized protein n=1 Tax=Nocardia macrotermitis TaxID=2585198 RepID=A0A7K0D2C5_9NOCA|nr:hypothetical protein [Nocardia macrotermitis]MQY19876.1 hypothetical protein [Nocardia macrotermitis]